MSRLVVGESYLMDDDFVGETEGELTAMKGYKVTVLEAEDPNNPGWIFVQLGADSGFVPSDFLVPDAPAPAPPAPPPAVGTPAYAAAAVPAYPTTSAQTPFEKQGSSRLFNDPPASYGGRSQADLAEADRKFKAEQRLISIDLWNYREELLGPCDPPRPPSRRWFYRDFFGDIQGPFNAPEMKDRLGMQYIKDDSIVSMEIGSGEVSKYEEETLRDLFRAPEAAFVESPRLTRIGGSTWYYMSRSGQEEGPFSCEQMRLWFNAGYMGGDILVRLANGQSAMTPLKDVYPDPANSFLSPPRLAGADVSKFPTPTTAVLIRPARMTKKESYNATDHTQATEKVEVIAAPPPAPGAPAPPPPAPRTGRDEHMQIYGSAWGEFAGVPSPHNLKQNVYSSLLYTFLTRPLHPDAGTVQCYIRRDIDGSHINFNKYVLFLEETNTPIMAAFRHHHTVHNYYDIKMNTTGKLTDNARGLTIANLELNFVGTTFLLHNNVSGHQGTPRDLGCTVYERNRVSNKGPRKMKVGIPAVKPDKPEFVEWKHEGNKNAPMVNSLKAITTKDLIPLLNKPPRWNEKKKAYMLDFKGRVTRSSVKNFQLVDAIRDPDHKSVLLQHGRVGVNKFTMDVKHPLSILQAFCICLSSLHSKKAVD
uniref:Uncharacterized protein n=1 Tax=Mucochytrium quahogii TaxID=96639 RepID=A0A7S2W596_9STRA|mmetsp:Transcript_6859/g.10847  ORF Transcript_6859/g.10847 Transcript_6859/m.10847 type:complete len:646 (+) Transcript_6859:73-2010(+)